MIQTTQQKAQSGTHRDLLADILNIQVRNTDKITEQDRLYCQNQQDALYETLDRIEHWYSIFKTEAEKYRDMKKFSYADNGSVSASDFQFQYGNTDDYSHYEFKPFDMINNLVKSNYSANKSFANRIISYFNTTYNVSVPEFSLDEKTLPMGFRPIYETYVDAVIEHLGGKSFRDTAEEEIIKRFIDVVRPSRWSKVKPELKKDRITFPDIIRWDDFNYQYSKEYNFSYGSDEKFNTFCEGIAFGADDMINGSNQIFLGYRYRMNFDISRWYDLSTTNAEQVKLYGNGRIDVKFKDAAAAERCFKRLNLDEITLQEN